MNILCADMVAGSAGGEQNTHPGLPDGVQGSKAVVQERKKEVRTTSEPFKKKRPAGKAVVKIRNYNIKD